MVQYIANINNKDKFSNTPLEIACKANTTDIVNRLIALNVHQNYSDKNGLTVIFPCKLLTILKQLMIGGINLNHVTRDNSLTNGRSYPLNIQDSFEKTTLMCRHRGECYSSRLQRPNSF